VLKLNIRKIELIIISLEKNNKFKANYGEFDERELLLVKLYTEEGLVGWGSCPTLGPFYSGETIGSAVYLIKNQISLRIIGKEITSIEEYHGLMGDIRGNKFALASVELGLWDLFAQKEQKPLYEYLGGEKNEVECGYSLGMIKESTELVLDKIKEVHNKGYRRIKLKITPGWDVKIVDEVRSYFPGISLMVDCNGGYKLDDMEIFKELDKYNLDMIEQPFYYKDLYEHSILQKKIDTPVCLDESIESFQDMRTAVELESCKIVNIKPYRVGGLYPAIQINNLCRDNNIPVWAGSMHESGIGRAFNIALATLPNFSFPADIVQTNESFKEDIINSESFLFKNGITTLNRTSGLGVKINNELLEKHKKETIIID